MNTAPDYNTMTNADLIMALRANSELRHETMLKHRAEIEALRDEYRHWCKTVYGATRDAILTELKRRTAEHKSELDAKKAAKLEALIVKAEALKAKEAEEAA